MSRIIFELDGEWEKKDIYHFPIGPRPWQRVTKYGGKLPRTRSYQQIIAEIAREKIDSGETETRKGRLALVIICHTRKFSSDLDNCLKNILDALNRIAWIDDKQIDALCVQRILKPDRLGEDHTELRIYEAVNNEL